MSEEPNAPAPADGEDTAAVLAMASGDKAYLEPKPEPEAKAEEPKADEQPGDDAAAPAEPEAKADEPKPKKTAQERINDLTRDKYEIAREKDREIEFWKAKALQPASGQPAQEAQPSAQPQGDGRPDPAKYELGNYDPQFIEDLTDWKAEEAAGRIAAQQAAQRQTTDAVSKFQSQTEKLFPDGPTEGLQAFLRQPTLPVGVLEVIAASDIGPKLAEHLGDNPAELNRLAGLSPVQQARELTRLETRLAPPPEPARPPPKTATDAPEPPPQARGAGGQFKVAADTDDFAAFEKQYRIGG